MKLVFTKLTTPLNSILVDHGDGRGFVNIPVASLEGSEQYIELDDNAVERSIRVKTSTEEIENFDMIKEYQIKDDEGNIIGGNVGGESSEISNIEEIICYISEISGRYRLTLSNDNDKAGKFFATFNSNLCYFATDDYISVAHLEDFYTIEAANGKQLYLRTLSNQDEYYYTPVPYKIKLAENPGYEEPPTEIYPEQN